MTAKTAKNEFLSHIRFGLAEAKALQGAEKAELLANLAEQVIGVLDRRGAKVDHLRFGLTESGQLNGDDAIEALEILMDEAMYAFERLASR